MLVPLRFGFGNRYCLPSDMAEKKARARSLWIWTKSFSMLVITRFVIVLDKIPVSLGFFNHIVKMNRMNKMSTSSTSSSHLHDLVSLKSQTGYFVVLIAQIA